ncbi:MAG: formate dehydrogenase accessory sulfurtransferase FdhD [Desulfobacterales bacterium]|nr:formate dehydrogenase accessory sulfurtransferase FdhD [Desulfobacterales bacterium]
MDTVYDYKVKFLCKEANISAYHALIGEEPLSIYIQGMPYCIGMRTPGEEVEHAAGFCLVEGIVDTVDDFSSLDYCDEKDKNVVNITLKQSKQNKIPQLIDRYGFTGRKNFAYSSRGPMDTFRQIIPPLDTALAIDLKKAVCSLENLSKHQPLRNKTRASHAAAIYTSTFQLLSIAEDVGRHNAMDKAIGKVFLDRKLEKASIIVLSSRISYELVEKAARARIPVILAISRPTALAVKVGSQYKMTLACLAKGSGLYVFCGEQRFQDSCLFY